MNALRTRWVLTVDILYLRSPIQLYQLTSPVATASAVGTVTSPNLKALVGISI